MFSTELMQDVNVLSGVYEPSEARQVLWGVIDKQIDFYKIQYLSRWEGNHNTSCEYFDRKVEELTAKRQEILQLVKEAKAEGRQIRLGGTIEMSFE